MVQPKAEMDLQFESTKLSTPWGYISAIVLCVATFGTIAIMSGLFLKPDATFDDYLADVVPLFGGFLSILGVSEVYYLLLTRQTLHLSVLFSYTDYRVPTVCSKGLLLSSLNKVVSIVNLLYGLAVRPVLWEFNLKTTYCNEAFQDIELNIYVQFKMLLQVKCTKSCFVCVLQITTRVTAARYGVKLSPSFLVPSNWTGCLGVMNNYESLLPNKKALFDIPVARTASAYLTSLALAVAAFVADGSFNGGDNAL